MVGWKAPLLPVARQDGREIEPLPNRVPDEVSEVSLRHELVHRRRQQPALVHVPRTECLGHAPSESSRNTAVEHYSDRLLGVHPRTVKRGREKEASCPSVRPAPPRRMSKCVRVKVCPAPICSEGASVCVSNKPPGVVSAAAIARLPASDEPSPERVNDPRWAELLVQGCRSTRPRRDSRVAPAR